MKFTTLVAAATGRRRHSDSAAARHGQPRRAAAVLAAAALAAGLAACSSSSGGSTSGGSSTGSTSGGKLTVADVAPFSGADAALGPYLPGFLLRRHGGDQQGRRGARAHADLQERGHPGRPRGRGPGGEPDVRVHAQPGLVIGCTSDEAASVVPIINAHKMAMFCMTGQSEFDHVHYPYFYRLVPPDLEESYAMVAIAQASCTTSG